MPHQTYGQADTSSVNTNNSITEQGLHLNYSSPLPLPQDSSVESPLPDSLKATSAFPANPQDSMRQPNDSSEYPVQGTEKTNGNYDSLTELKPTTSSTYYGNGFKGYHAAGRGVPTPGASSGKKRILLVDTLKTDSAPPSPAPLQVTTDSSVSTPPVKLGKTGKIITAAIIILVIGGSIAALYLKSQKETETENKDRIPAPPLPPDN